ncbi:MAG: glutathione S-transferase C-terminal domain-containing protein, partial [Pseudomonadota bacterium]
EVLSLEANADAILEAAVGMVYEMRFRADHDLVWDTWLDVQWAKITRSLDALETRSMPLLEGPLNMGQIGIGCALGYLDFRHGDRDWRGGRDTLTAWEARFAEREAMQATKPA